MGLDDIGISFVVSLVANIATNVFSGNKKLESKINDCFCKALEKWEMPQETRDKMKFCSIKLYSDLKVYLENPSQGIHPKVKELLQLWVNEMSKDLDCRSFITSFKLDIHNKKLNDILSVLNYEYKPKIDGLSQQVESIQESIQHLMFQLNQSNTDEVLVTKIESFIRGVVESLIESLKLDSARRIISEFEAQFSNTIEKNTSLQALVCYRKAQTLLFINNKYSSDLRHKAYTLQPSCKLYIRNEVVRSIFKHDYCSAKKLLEELPGELKYFYIIEVLNSENSKNAYELIPDEFKDDYDFKELLFEALINDGQQDVSFLFSDDKIVTPSSFTFSNLKSWIFAALASRVQCQDFLALSFDAPQIKAMSQYRDVVDKFYKNLLTTEIHDCFPIVKAIYYYWKYLTTRDCSWLDEFQKLDKKKFGEQRLFFEMVESSMLILAARYEEAFAVLVGINSKMDSVFIQYVIMMSTISNNILYLRWVLNKAKDLDIKIESNVSLYIAHSINKERAEEIRNIISDNDFKNSCEKSLLIQLCDYYSGKKINVLEFKDEVDRLEDGMKAYAANLLAVNGDTLLAFEMLKDIVDETKPDFKQNVYLSVLDKMAEKKPELYNILINNRKHGNYCSDNLLYKEFCLDAKISDYENAFEAIKELYRRHPGEVRIFSNYIFALGHIHPKQLSQYENEALAFHTENNDDAILMYRAFAENKYFKTAAEILYRAAKASEDLNLRNFYHNETMVGLISPIAREEKNVAEEGDFVLCDVDGNRYFYKATLFGAAIGKTVLGVSKGDIIETELSFKSVRLVVIGIFNKYYKLAADIMYEAQDGSNPGLMPFQIDMERPLESLEDVLRKISGKEENPEERRRKAYVDYESGKLALLNLVNETNPIASYYKYLFTPFKIHVNCSIIEIQQMPRPSIDSIFILDIPTIITFAEFTAKTQLEILGPKYVTTIQQDMIDTTNKSIIKFMESDFYEAMASDKLVKYNDSIDCDAITHIQKLAKWIQDNCKVIVPDAALALSGDCDNSSKLLLMGSMAMLTRPNYYYVTDDIHLKNMIPYNKIICSETFVKCFNSDAVSKSYSRFLFECNFRGVSLDEDYILEEYEKMKKGFDNHMVEIMQNMIENPYLISIAAKCCMELAEKEIDTNSLRLTFTNMFAMSLKGFLPNKRYALYKQMDQSLTIPLFAMQFVRSCLRDAMQIVDAGEIIVS